MKIKNLLEYDIVGKEKNIPSVDMPLSLFEMATISSKRSGIDLKIWTSQKRGSHGPRVKVTKVGEQLTNSNSCSVTISDSPEIVAGNIKIISTSQFKELKKWIVLNKDVLIKLWNHGYEDSGDFLEDIKKL